MKKYSVTKVTRAKESTSNLPESHITENSKRQYCETLESYGTLLGKLSEFISKTLGVFQIGSDGLLATVTCVQ